MADKAAAAKNIANLTADKDFFDRIKYYYEQGDALIGENEKDVIITDPARVYAEIALLNKRVLDRDFWSEVDFSSSTGEKQFFTTATSKSTVHTTNLPGSGSFNRDEIFFAKGISCHFHRDMTQADKRIAMDDGILQFEIYGRMIVEKKLRYLRSGFGLDGELNNGVPDGKIFELNGYLRIPPNQKFEVVVQQLTALSGTNSKVTIGLHGLMGDRK